MAFCFRGHSRPVAFLCFKGLEGLSYKNFIFLNHCNKAE